MSYSSKFEFFLENEIATAKIAAQFAGICQSWFNQGGSRLMVSLAGDLGAGKSFFARHVIQSFLPEQKVKSPTYALVESYQLPFAMIQHFDLYRLCDPEELEFLAIRELLAMPVIALVEWAEKGCGFLPEFDLIVSLSPMQKEDVIGRKIVFEVLDDSLTDLFKQALMRESVE